MNLYFVNAMKDPIKNQRNMHFIMDAYKFVESDPQKAMLSCSLGA